MAVMQAAPSLGHSSSPPAKQMAAPQYNRRKPLFSAPRKRSVGRHSQMTFPGEDAPGTGPQPLPHSALPCHCNSAEEDSVTACAPCHSCKVCWTRFATCQLIVAQLNSDAPCKPASLSSEEQHASCMCADILTAMTGRRHFPEELRETRISTAERPESFGMRSTQDMYREFPAAVRSSFPLYVRTAGPQVCPICPTMVLTASKYYLLQLVSSTSYPALLSGSFRSQYGSYVI